MSLYEEGNIDELGELHIDPIIFNPATYQSDMHFELLTSHDFFRLSAKNYTVQLQLNQNFTWQLLDDMDEFLKLTLMASWESLSSVTHIVIKLPQIKDKIEPQMFEFQKPLYMGQLNATDELEMEKILLQTDVNDDEQQYLKLSLSGNDSAQFYILSNGREIEIKTNFSTTPTLNEYILVLEAKTNERKTFSTLIIKNYPTNIPVIITKKLFVDDIVVGHIVYDNSTLLQRYWGEPIYVSANVRENLQNLKFNLSGGLYLR